MHIVRYIFRRLAAYICFVIIMLIMMQLFKNISGTPFSALYDNIFMAVIFFAYPIYRVVRSTIATVVIFFDKTSQESEGERKFAGVFHVLMTNFWENKIHRAFAINILLKFLQLTALISMIYAFISNDFRVLKPVAILSAIVGLAFTLAFVRTQKFEYELRNGEQLKKLEALRQAPGGMSISQDRRKAFMNFPRISFIINLIVVAAGLLIAFITSKIPFSITSPFLFDIKIIGVLATRILPFTGIYLFYQNLGSHMYTLRLGKGDYGQEKIEFFTYSGSGDEMQDTRYIIDRVETFEIGSRYIKLLKPAAIKYIRIPRTMSFDEERVLLEMIRRMRYPADILKFSDFTHDKEIKRL